MHQNEYGAVRGPAEWDRGSSPMARLHFLHCIDMYRRDLVIYNIYALIHLLDV